MIKLVISVLIAIYLLLALIAASPPCPLTVAVTNFGNQSLNRLGLMNSFAVFAPLPDHENQIFYAVVHYADGSVDRHDLVNTSDRNVNYFQRLHQCLWVFWQYKLNTGAPLVRQRLLSDAGHFIARSCRDDGRTPVKVSIWRTYKPIKLPNEKSVAHASSEKLIDYIVEPRALQ